MLYVNQSLAIDEKFKAICNPGSVVDVDVTSGSVKVKLTNNISLPVKNSKDSQ